MSSWLIVLFALTFTSCSNSNDDDNNNNNNNPTVTEVEDTVNSGTWRISNFIDSDENETHHFNGYNFTFASNGTLTATNGSVTHTGTWSVTDSNSNDDDGSLDDIDFNIHFNLTNNFEDLNDDWDIVSRTSTRLELIDISGGNGGTDYLTFEKN